MNILLATHHLLTLMEGELRLAARARGLGLADVLVMAWLRQAGELASADIARNLGRPRQNVRRTLEALKRQGLAQSLDSAFTGRNVAWALTDSGRQRFDDLASTLQPDTMLFRAPGLDFEQVARDLFRCSAPTEAPRMAVTHGTFASRQNGSRRRRGTREGSVGDSHRGEGEGWSARVDVNDVVADINDVSSASTPPRLPSHFESPQAHGAARGTQSAYCLDHRPQAKGQPSPV